MERLTIDDKRVGRKQTETTPRQLPTHDLMGNPLEEGRSYNTVPLPNLGPGGFFGVVPPGASGPAFLEEVNLASQPTLEIPNGSESDSELADVPAGLGNFGDEFEDDSEDEL